MLVWAAITKSWVAYTIEIYMFTVLEARKSTTKVLADLVSEEGPLPGLQVATSRCVLTWFFLCAHTKEAGGGRDREKQRD